jgi:hypothetical protein
MIIGFSASIFVFISYSKLNPFGNTDKRKEEDAEDDDLQS